MAKIKVPKDKWQQTGIGEMLHLFAGEMQEIIESQLNSQSVVRLERWLPMVFWRWYHLQSQVDHQMTPAMFLDWRREVEKWPKDGMFVAKPTLEIQADGGLSLGVEADYIDVTGQPLMLDVVNRLTDKPLVGRFDSLYPQLVDQMAIQVRQHGWWSKGKLTHLEEVTALFVEQILTRWWVEDELIGQAWTLPEWLRFWDEILLEARELGELGSDSLGDEFCERMRRVVPEYGLTHAEMEAMELGQEPSRISMESSVAMWMGICRSWLLPMSLYMMLVEPVLVERQMFAGDLRALLDFPGQTDPMPLYTPFTAIRLTPFGERMMEQL